MEKQMLKDKETDYAGRNRKNTFLVINILAPLIVGAVIYYIISPEVLFVQRIDAFAGKELHIRGIDYSNIVFRFVRNYGLDMLWGYAYVFALFFVFDSNAAGLMKILLVSFVFAAVMEILQLTSIVEGTFDVIDICVEFLAEVAAVFIIKTYCLRGGSKENEKEI